MRLHRNPRRLTAAFFAVLTLVALTPTAALAQQGNGGAIQVDGVLGSAVNPDGTVTPLAGATVRNARLAVESFHVVQVTNSAGELVNQLLASGVVTGVASLPDGRTVRFTQAFTDVPAGFDTGAAAAGGITIQQTTCPILDLDIGAIHLDLLGLVLDLAPIHLDLVAERGPGNLLGNLLCAIVGLFD